MDEPSRVIVTASIAGLGVGSLGENATFGYSASKGKPPVPPIFESGFFLVDVLPSSGCNSPYPQSGC